MEAHYASKRPKPGQPSRVDIQARPSNANVRLFQRERDIQICTGALHFSWSADYLSQSHAAIAPAPKPYGDSPHAHQVGTVEVMIDGMLPPRGNECCGIKF